MNIDFGFVLTELQQMVLDYADRFESDPDARHELFAYSHTYTAWGLTREETAELPAKFNHCDSAIWLREAARGYLIYLNYLVGTIRGEEVPTLILPEDFVRIANIEVLRSEWLRVPAFADAVQAFVLALRETMDYFNVQLVSHWMRTTLYKTSICDEKLPYMLGIPLEQSTQELLSLEEAAYDRAEELYRNQCRVTYDAMMTAQGFDERVRVFFTFTREQLMMIASYNRAAREINPDLIVAMDPPVSEPLPVWKQIESGIFVPDGC